MHPLDVLSDFVPGRRSTARGQIGAAELIQLGEGRRVGQTEGEVELVQVAVGEVGVVGADEVGSVAERDDRDRLAGPGAG